MELGNSTGLFVGLFLGQWARDHTRRAQPCIPGFPQHQALCGARPHKLTAQGWGIGSMVWWAAHPPPKAATSKWPNLTLSPWGDLGSQDAPK